ncbi:MAG TPA: ATP synthase subunit I [Pyrinomonadaceae bacterium]
MKKSQDNGRGTMPSASGDKYPETHDSRIEKRVLRIMAVSVAVAVVASFSFAPLRVTAGLLLGGLLSLLNHHWLSSSTAAAFNVIAHGTKPQLKLTQYILRYFVIGTVVFLAYKLNLVSLAATIAGLCSFVVALFVEAFREFYFAIIHREETN